MPAKVASFSRCHSGGVRASMRASSGPPRLSDAGMPWDGSNASMKPWTSSRIPSSGGMKDQAVVSMRISERTRSGRARTTPIDDPAAHGMAQQVDRAAAHRLDERAEVRRQLPDGVALEPARPGRVPVPALVERDHAAVGRQRVRRQREVERGAGEPVAEHQGRGPRRTAPPLGPRQVDAVDVEGPGRCHVPCLAARPRRSPDAGRRGGAEASSPSRSRAPAPSPATRVRSRSAPRPGAPPA